jgi:TolB-like protein/Tfp pilus assembly protein PilF
MVCGTPPFVGKTPPDVLSAILSEQQPPPLPPEVPAVLSFFIKKALSKKRKMRYQTVHDLQNDLQRLRQDIESTAQHDSSIAESRSDEEAINESARKPGKSSSSSNRAASLSSKPRLRKKIDSLAVLPLANASADPNMEYLSDGITESIINSLSQLPQLKVMSRSTVFRYKGQKGREEVNPKEVGSELNVRAVMTGRVLQFADNLIIQTELVDTVDGSQIWGEQYKRKSSDIFEVQEEISKEISDKLRIRLSGEDKKRLTKRYTQNPDAYQLYLKGRYYWNKRTLEGLEKGIEYFHQAIGLDPNYALAYAGLADSYNLLGAIEHGVSPKEFMPKAREAALKALKLDDKLAEAHTSLGNVKGSSWEWLEAEIEYRKAIKLNPNYATAHHWYALLLMAMERFDESFKEIRRAKELDPLSLPINLGEGWHFYLARQYDRAREECLKTIDLEPNFGNAHACLGMVYGQKELFEEAITEFKISIKLAADAPLMHAALGYAYAISGKSDEARRVINELVERAKHRYISPYLIAAIFTGLGEKEEAFAWLDRAYEERSEGLFWLRVEPTMDSLRSDPRFVDLMRRMNYPR